MARDIDLSKPLSAEDLAYLRQRYGSTYIEHAVRVSGTDLSALEGGDSGPSPAETQEALEEADRKAEADRLAAEAAEAEERAKAEVERQRQEAEDLIGSGTFDVLGSTEAEVKAWAESASDEDRAAALETEQSREDRDPRKGVVSLLS